MVENDLRQAIYEALQHVTVASSPQVYKRIQTKKGYAVIQEQIIEKMIRFHMEPEVVIPQLEMEFDEFTYD
jgi:hypothetical protein